jgi:hypothetical protein
MSKTKAVAITQAAQMAGTKLWDAVEAEAKNRLAEAETKKELSDSFAETSLSLARRKIAGTCGSF